MTPFAVSFAQSWLRTSRKAAECAALQTLSRVTTGVEFREAFGVRGIPALWKVSGNHCPYRVRTDS